MIIGLLTDTHLPNVIRQLEELGPEPAEFFGGVDLILHGGDLTAPYVLDWLEQFAPVLCSTGNNDPIPDSRCKDVQVIEVEGWRIGMTHSLEGQFRPMSVLSQYFPSPVDVMVAGHTHEERLEHRDGITPHQQRLDHVSAPQGTSTGHGWAAGADGTPAGRQGLPAGTHGGETESRA